MYAIFYQAKHYIYPFAKFLTGNKLCLNYYIYELNIGPCRIKRLPVEVFEVRLYTIYTS